MGFISTLIEDVFSPNSETMRDAMSLIRNLGVQLPGVDARALDGTHNVEPIRIGQNSAVIDQTKMVA